MNKIIKILLLTLPLLLISCSDNNNNPAWKMNAQCDLNTEQCSSQHEGQQVSISLSPNTPVAIAKKLAVEVKLENISAQLVKLDISGINMYMGYNQVQLEKISEGLYRGKTMLAFCTESKMEWKVMVLLINKDGITTEVPFSLTTIQDGKTF